MGVVAGEASVFFVTDQMHDALRPLAILRASLGFEDHVVGNPAARRNRAEQALLAELTQQIDATPIEPRTYF